MYQVPQSIKTRLADMDKAAPSSNTREWVVKQPHLSVKVSIKHEEIEPDGCFSDLKDVAWVKRQMKKDNMYAWCQVSVQVEYYYWDDDTEEQVTVFATDCLGGCSYKSREDMKPLLDEMTGNALHELAKSPQVLVEDF